MSQHYNAEPDYGTGKKNLNLYIVGVVLCIILTLIPFSVTVSSHKYSVGLALTVIYICAIAQFLVQVFFFLRLHAKNERGRMNSISFVFVILVLIVIVIGSLWIMWHLNYNMMH